MSRHALTATQADVAPDRNSPPRLAYRVDEVAEMLGVGRRTVERAVSDGRLRSSKRLGVRLIDAESVKELLTDRVA